MNEYLNDETQHCEVREDCVCIYHGHEGDKEYKVPLSDLISPERLIGWIRHISTKGWIKPKTIRLFAEAVVEHFDWKNCQP